MLNSPYSSPRYYTLPTIDKGRKQTTEKVVALLTDDRGQDEREAESEEQLVIMPRCIEAPDSGVLDDEA